MNNNKFIDMAEFMQEAMQRYSEESGKLGLDKTTMESNVELAMQRLDTNGDGLIDATEFSTGQSAVSGQFGSKNSNKVTAITETNPTEMPTPITGKILYDSSDESTDSTIDDLLKEWADEVE